MNPLKYFSPRYWARKLFGVRPAAGGGLPQPTATRFEIVPPEERGIIVAIDATTETVLPETRGIAILRLIRGREARPETRGIFVNAEERGAEA